MMLLPVSGPIFFPGGWPVPWSVLGRIVGPGGGGVYKADPHPTLLGTKAGVGVRIILECCLVFEYMMNR